MVSRGVIEKYKGLGHLSYNLKEPIHIDILYLLDSRYYTGLSQSLIPEI